MNLFIVLFVLIKSIFCKISIPIIKRTCSVNKDFIENSDILNNTDFKCIVATFNIGSPKQSFSLLIDTNILESLVFSLDLKKEVLNVMNQKSQPLIWIQEIKNKLTSINTLVFLLKIISCMKGKVNQKIDLYLG